MQFPSSFFSKCFIIVYVVLLYRSADTDTAWNNSHFILFSLSPSLSLSLSLSC